VAIVQRPCLTSAIGEDVVVLRFNELGVQGFHHMVDVLTQHKVDLTIEI